MVKVVLKDDEVILYIDGTRRGTFTYEETDTVLNVVKAINSFSNVDIDLKIENKRSKE